MNAVDLATYARDGYLVLEGFLPPTDCDTLQARVAELVAAFDPGPVRTVFSARDQGHARDRYFQESGGAIRFFFEEQATDRPVPLALNKIGHALHDLDPDFAAFSRDPRLAAIAAAIGVRQPQLLQSMIILKPPGIGGEVGAHQDATFLYTDPVSVHGFWFALEDATLDNGCLWALPGGHRLGLKRRFRRTEGGVAFEDLDPRPLPEPPTGYVPLEAKKGTLVLLDGLSPHWSAANRSALSRVAYSLHVIDGIAHYPADNWLRRGPHLPLRGF